MLYNELLSTNHGNPAEVRLRQSHSSNFTALSDVPCCQEDPKDTDMITKFTENQKNKTTAHIWQQTVVKECSL